jgi:hypothetical protein
MLHSPAVSLLCVSARCAVSRTTPHRSAKLSLTVTGPVSATRRHSSNHTILLRGSEGVIWPCVKAVPADIRGTNIHCGNQACGKGISSANSVASRQLYGFPSALPIRSQRSGEGISSANSMASCQLYGIPQPCPSGRNNNATGFFLRIAEMERASCATSSR